MHSRIERMHYCIVFSYIRTSVPNLSSGELPPRFQLQMTSEKNYSADISSFCLGDGPVRWSFCSWFQKRWIRDWYLYQVTHSSLESDMMDRWPYNSYCTAVPAEPHSQWHPSCVTPSSCESDMIQWFPETTDWVAVPAPLHSQ